MPRGERVCWSIFKFYIHVPDLFPLSSIKSSPRLHLSYSLAVYPLGGWTRLCCMLALPGTSRLHDKGGSNPLTLKAPIMMGGVLL